ncbi:hypothetical protein BGX30_014841 [Mortierella sp. GBA39]|nr:hypothetical protein BGX30_014841 [Mortierella sp. GBA39]
MALRDVAARPNIYLLLQRQKILTKRTYAGQENPASAPTPSQPSLMDTAICKTASGTTRRPTPLGIIIRPTSASSRTQTAPRYSLWRSRIRSWFHI